MGTSWHNGKVSESFNKYNDMLEDILGFHYVFQIIQEYPNVKSILDFGCGPGKVSERLSVLNNEYNIIAVDQSQSMIEIASTLRNCKNIQYQLIQNNSLDFIKSKSIDCAIICFVIINNSSPECISNILKEVYRVLRKDGCLIILDSNPSAVGINFTTFTNGDKGKQYEQGEGKKQYLKVPNEPDLILNDWFWTKEIYLKWLSEAGFNSIHYLEPTINDFPQKDRLLFEEKYKFYDWGEEKNNPPFIIFKSIKS